MEADPLTVEYHSHFLPEADDGPITATMEIEVAPENHIRFFRLMEEIRLIYFRKERSAPRLDQDFENPNRFRLQAMFISWGALQRFDQRITRDEHALWSELWTPHCGQESPRPKRYLGSQHWKPQESGGLKPVSTLPTPDGRA